MWAIATVMLLALAAGLALASAPAAQGWLAAFVIWSTVPIGSLVLLLIHRLVGGRWGKAIAPVLLPAASLLPMAVLAFIPVAVALPAIYPWAAHPDSLSPDLTHYYLNESLFVMRAALALGGWSILGLLIVQGRCTRLAAGLGLAFYGLMISLVAVDWILSIEPRFTSSAFAAGIAIQQILAALAWAALAAPEAPGDPAAGDLGGLLIAALLGVVYISLMSYIVSWYGDLPDKAVWYLRRGSGAWSWTIAAAVVLGTAIPFALLLKRSFRRSRQVLRIVGALILIGVWLHLTWLIAPTFAPGWPIFAVAGLIVLSGLSIGLVKAAPYRRNERPAHAR
jgi:hypothetical protein